MKDKKKLVIISLAIIAILITIGAVKIKKTRDMNAIAEEIMIERIMDEKSESKRIEIEKLATEKEEYERLEAEKIATEKVEVERLEAERLAAINPLEDIKISYSVYDVNDYTVAKPAPFKNIMRFYGASDYEIDTMNLFHNLNDSNIITMTRPGSELTLSFENNGDIIPKNPSIILDFDNFMLYNDVSEYLRYYDDGMEASNHVHGMGYYTKFKWYLGEKNLLYKDQPLTMSSISFGGSEVEKDIPGELKITLVDSEANKVEYIFIIEVEARD